jgi:hypothetical protein
VDSSANLYGLYSAISQGIAGIGIASIQSLSDDDRWALTFYIAELRGKAAVIAKGGGIPGKKGVLSG